MLDIDVAFKPFWSYTTVKKAIPDMNRTTRSWLAIRCTAKLISWPDEVDVTVEDVDSCEELEYMVDATGTAFDVAVGTATIMTVALVTAF